MVKNEEEVKMPSREEIMKIAEERTRRDVAETRMKGAAKELGFSADVDPAVLEREVKKSIHFEVGERVYAMARGLLFLSGCRNSRTNSSPSVQQIRENGKSATSAT